MAYKMVSGRGNDLATALQRSLLSATVVLISLSTKKLLALQVLLKSWIHEVRLGIDKR